MSIKFSTGLRNAWLADAFLQGADLAYVDGGGSADTIVDNSGDDRFIDAGFRVGDAITTTGSTTAGNDLTAVVLTGVTVDTLSFATGSLVGDVSEAFLAATTLQGNNGASLASILYNGTIRVFGGGTVPASADDAEEGSLLLQITASGGAFVPGAATNGLKLQPILNGALSKESTEWSGLALADGTAKWARYYDNNMVTGASKSARRWDCLVSVSSSTFKLSSTLLVEDVPVTVNVCTISLPATKA